jgi:3-oxoacyl-[acyl-carrier-protein] synthase III
MNFTFQNKKITGILTVLPGNEVKFDDEIENYSFSAAKSMKLKLTMGYNTRRVVKEGICVSDLCVFGLEHLFAKSLLKKEEIDALILVTQSPDYFMPPTSNVIQGHLNLKQDMICLDINQGCAGYIIGIIQAFMMLEQKEISKVVLLNADVLSRKVSKKDRNSNPLIGDGASITIVEKSDAPCKIYGNLKMDGNGASALMIPAGGFKMPASEQTSILNEDSAGNLRSLDNLVMKGDEVFNFVQREVPPMIEQLIVDSESRKEKIDYYMFHQPNKFMLQKLADKLRVDRNKMPADIVENYGNSSGVSIPTAITHTVGNKLLDNDFLMCLAGFGVGLTWGSLLLNIGNIDFCEMINFK